MGRVDGQCRRRQLDAAGATHVGTGDLTMVMVMMRRTRPLMKKTRAEQHGDDNAKESVVPHLVPP